MTPARLAKELEAVRQKCADHLQIRINRVCIETGAKFYCGMGAWGFELPNGKTIAKGFEDCKTPRKVYRLAVTLRTYQIAHEIDLTYYLNDFKP